MTAPAQILSADDAVARCAINPRFLRKGRFHHAYLLDFKKPKGTTDFVTSVGWRKLLPTEASVHAYGCRSAAFSNSRKETPPVPVKEAAHYLGFYELAVSQALEESNDVYDVRVEQLEENGEAAHCHIVLTEKGNLTKELVQLKGASRTNILLGIWANMTGPTRHICECDLAYCNELSAIKLSPPGTPDDLDEDEMGVV